MASNVRPRTNSLFLLSLTNASPAWDLDDVEEGRAILDTLIKIDFEEQQEEQQEKLRK